MTLAHFFWNGFDGLMSFGVMEIIASILGILLWSGFWILVVVLIVKLVRGGGRASRSGALAVLEERYARGEITRAEFLERRDVLEGRAPPAPSGTHP